MVIVSVQAKSKLFLDIPDFPSALAELGSGSYDGVVQGLKILGNYLEPIFPEVYSLPRQWSALKGQERVQILTIQKKACQILTTLIKDPQTDVHSDKSLQNRLATIEFITEMSMEFGQMVTKKVYQNIQETCRNSLDSGEETFTEEMQVEFQKRLTRAQSKLIQQKLEFELPQPPDNSSLPTMDERIAYWSSVAEVTRSKEGHMGVFYTHSPNVRKDLVVKAPLRPVQECFASRIFQRLGFPTPDTLVIDRKSKEGRLMEKALAISPDFIQHCKEVPFTKFLVMNRVYGRAFEEIDEAVAAAAFKNDERSLSNLLKQVGMVAAVDTLLHYQDRLPHIGCANWGNLMCVEQNGRLITSVAIDQSVDVSKTSVFLPAGTKLARIEQIADDVLTTPEKNSQAADEIWEEMPVEFKTYTSKDKALAMIQEGLVEGFKMIVSTLTPKSLEEIDRSLSDLYVKSDDFVIVNDLIKAVEIVSARIG